MNRIITLISIMLSALILMSCAEGRYPYPADELSQEAWRPQVQTNSDPWALKADRWFRAGDETINEKRDRHMRPSNPMRPVRSAYFNSIRVSGDVEVKIDGDPDIDSVWVEGPSDVTQFLVVNVRNSILCIEQLEKAPPGIRRVTVHVQIRNLKSLIHNGSGRVEGVRLFTNKLNIESYGSGNIFLAGHMNVKSIVARGSGSVNVFTVYANGLSIETSGSGSVNVDAKQAVVLRSINHSGIGDINIIGAASRELVVKAEGKGKIGITGCVNVKEIRASGQTCVFIPASVSNSANIYVDDDARVGIAGVVREYTGYTHRTSRLMARYLQAQTVYVEASGTSHMNVSASRRVFATARDYATIYYYGYPGILNGFQRNNGSVIEMTANYAPPGPYVLNPPRQVRRGDSLDPVINMSSNSEQPEWRRSGWSNDYAI